MARTWQIVLATIGIFVAGIVAGAATALGIVHWAVRHPRAVPPGLALFNPRIGHQQPFGPQLMRSFASKLDLTDEQRALVGPIIRRTASQLGHERRTAQLESILAIERMQNEIAAVLTPEQRTKFEELVSRERTRLQQIRAYQEQEPK